MRALEITDPYTEDFYYHSYCARHGATGVAGAGAAGGGGNVRVPLPVWKETKETGAKGGG